MGKLFCPACEKEITPSNSSHVCADIGPSLEKYPWDKSKWVDMTKPAAPAGEDEPLELGEPDEVPAWIHAHAPKPEADGKPARRDYWLGRKINGDILVFHVRPSTNMLAFHKIRSLEHVTELHPGDRVLSQTEVIGLMKHLIWVQTKSAHMDSKHGARINQEITAALALLKGEA